MLTAHASRTLTQPRENAVRDAQTVQADRRRRDIDNGIRRADFMKMHVLQRYAMGFGFGFGKNAERFFGDSPRSGRHVRLRKYRQNFRQSSMRMVMMFMPALMFMRMVVVVMFMRMVVMMFMLMLMRVVMPVKIMHIMVVIVFRENHVKVANVQPRLFDAAYFYLHAVQPQTVQHTPQRRFIRA